MKVLADRVMRVLRQVRGPETDDAVFEAAALIVGSAFLVLGFVVALPVFWGHELAISGSGSIGVFAAYGGALTAMISFTLGRLAVRPRRWIPDAVRDGFSVPGDRLRWYDLIVGGESAIRSAVENT